MKVRGAGAKSVRKRKKYFRKMALKVASESAN
jgi:hypothetical protein